MIRIVNRIDKRVACAIIIEEWLRTQPGNRCQQRNCGLCRSNAAQLGNRGTSSGELTVALDSTARCIEAATADGRPLSVIARRDCSAVVGLRQAGATACAKEGGGAPETNRTSDLPLRSEALIH